MKNCEHLAFKNKMCFARRKNHKVIDKRKADSKPPKAACWKGGGVNAELRTLCKCVALGSGFKQLCSTGTWGAQEATRGCTWRKKSGNPWPEKADCQERACNFCMLQKGATKFTAAAEEIKSEGCLCLFKANDKNTVPYYSLSTLHMPSSRLNAFPMHYHFTDGENRVRG